MSWAWAMLGLLGSGQHPLGAPWQGWGLPAPSSTPWQGWGAEGSSALRWLLPCSPDAEQGALGEGAAAEAGSPGRPVPKSQPGHRSYNLHERRCIGSMTAAEQDRYQKMPTDESEAQTLVSADLDYMKSEWGLHTWGCAPGAALVASLCRESGLEQWVRQCQWSGAGDGGFRTVGLALPGCLVAAAKLSVLPVLGTTAGDPSLVSPWCQC